MGLLQTLQNVWMNLQRRAVLAETLTVGITVKMHTKKDAFVTFMVPQAGRIHRHPLILHEWIVLLCGHYLSREQLILEV